MSKKLEEFVQVLSSTVMVLKEQNEKNQAAWESRITQLEKRIQPIRLEQDVLSCVQTSINKALDNALSGYNSPLSKLAESVVETYKGAIRDNMNVAMSEAISRGDFLQQMREAFVHRVARTLLAGMDGQIEKASNELKNDPQFKAKATLAIANIVNEMSVKQGSANA